MVVSSYVSLKNACRIAICLFVVALMTLQPVVAAFTPAERRRFAKGGIYFLDDVCAATDAAAASQSDSNANAQTAMKFYVGKGLTPEQAAGIVGNLRAESAVLPARQEGKPASYIATAPIAGTGFGIAQWTPASRQDPLVAAAQQVGVEANTLPIQLEYLWTELSTRYQNILTLLKATSTVRDATSVILRKFEAPKDSGDGVLDVRAGLADAELTRYIESGGGKVIVLAGCPGQAGAACKDITQESAKGDKNPYVCSNKDMTCPVGADGGVQDGYAEGVRYEIRICIVGGIKVNAFIAAKIDALLKQSALPKPEGGLGQALTANSGFRTMQQQIDIRSDPKRLCGDNQLPITQDEIYNAPSDSCSPGAARPGYSNHQMGLAIDFSGIAEVDPQNPKVLWLKANAPTYGGLYPNTSESWHWSVDGH